VSEILDLFKLEVEQVTRLINLVGKLNDEVLKLSIRVYELEGEVFNGSDD